MNKILVIGSIHMDILANVDPSTKENIDKIGQLRYSVGGTAFNVGANMAYHEKEVSIYSVLKEDGFSSKAIRAELSRRGLSSRLVRDIAMPAESGFVAHTQGGALVSAVSCIGIQDVTFEDDDLLHAIRESALIAIECNLAQNQIIQIANLARNEAKPLCVCAVSESKVSRIYKCFRNIDKPMFKLVVLNDLELKKVAENSDSKSICEDFSAEYVCITRGPNGFDILYPDGSIITSKVEIEAVISSLGAGDALYAGLCAHFLERAVLDPNQIANDAKRFLVPVLGSQNATPDIKNARKKSYMPIQVTSYTALAAFIVAGALAIGGLAGPDYHRTSFGVLVFLIPMLAGLAGCQVERLLNYKDTELTSQHEGILVRSTLGVAAGFVAGLLFVLPQIVGTNVFQTLDLTTAVPFQLRVLLPFCFVVGLIGGLTSDALLRRIMANDVVNAKLPTVTTKNVS